MNSLPKCEVKRASCAQGFVQDVQVKEKLKYRKPVRFLVAF